MGLLKPGIKARLESVTEFIKTSYHIAFIPFVIYMGMFFFILQNIKFKLFYHCHSVKHYSNTFSCTVQ